jgi:hypothetical protein
MMIGLFIFTVVFLHFKENKKTKTDWVVIAGDVGILKI